MTNTNNKFNYQLTEAALLVLDKAVCPVCSSPVKRPDVDSIVMCDLTDSVSDTTIFDDPFVLCSEQGSHWSGALRSLNGLNVPIPMIQDANNMDIIYAEGKAFAVLFGVDTANVENPDNPYDSNTTNSAIWEDGFNDGLNENRTLSTKP